MGHVAIEISKLFNKILRDYGELEAECIGNRYNAGQRTRAGIPCRLQNHWQLSIFKKASEKTGPERSER